MRKRIYEIIEPSKDDDTFSSIYDFSMIGFIVLSLLPLTMKNPASGWQIVDKICCLAFIIDYTLRWITADYKFGQHNAKSFVKYPFSVMAIIDLVSILPSITAMKGVFKVLRVTRLIRAFRVFRIFKTARYSKNMQILADVFRKSKDSLSAVATLALAYILIAALIIFNVEPSSFNNFFDAIYWATVSLTTVGYGDIYPITTLGRIVTMVSSIVGIAVVALPASILTAGYMSELKETQENKSENK